MATANMQRIVLPPPAAAPALQPALRSPTTMPTPLDYASPTRSTRPRRLWILAIFATALIALEEFQPRLTPPGWPTRLDVMLMLLLPIGAFVMAVATSLPGWSIGQYGLFGACIFLHGQFSDRRLKFHLETPGDIRWFVAWWSVFIFGSWIVCRSAVIFRRSRPDDAGQ